MEDASELRLGPEFSRAKCLMNAEVAMVLQRKHEQLQQLEESAGVAQPAQSQVFEKVLQYVRRVSRYSNPDAVREVLMRNQLHEFELCVLGNLCPDTVEEAKALVPSIALPGRLDDDAIETMLTNLATIKKFE